MGLRSEYEGLRSEAQCVMSDSRADSEMTGHIENSYLRSLRYYSKYSFRGFLSTTS